MQTKKTQLSNCKFLLEATASTEETFAALTEGVDAFLVRAGAAPKQPNETALDAMKERFGADMAEVALAQAAIDYLLPLALADARLIPACSPVPEVAGAPEAGKPYTFTTTVFMRPEMELSSYEAPSITLPLEEMGEAELAMAKANAAVAEMASRLVGELPQDIVAQMAQDMIGEIEEQFNQQGMTIDMALVKEEIERETFEAVMLQRAADSLASGLAMDAIYRHYQMELTDEDIEHTIRAIAATNAPEDQLEATIEAMMAQGRTPAIEEIAKRMKAGNWIADNAVVTVEASR